MSAIRTRVEELMNKIQDALANVELDRQYELESEANQLLCDITESTHLSEQDQCALTAFVVVSKVIIDRF